jgi:uncharacterized membrane protein YoaK (UPF0700 family)
MSPILPVVSAPAAAAPAHGPLPGLLLALTAVTGLVDAISYLSLGHVFVANMTGNIAFLGFAAADARDFSVAASLAATAAFLVGALAGGRLGTSLGRHRGRYLAVCVAIEILAVGGALLAALRTPELQGAALRYELIVLLALAMGLQNAMARRIGVPDLTTTVLTLTLTGLAADSRPAGGGNPRPVRRVLATVTMFLGAATGSIVIFRFGLAAVLAVTLAAMLACGVWAWRISRSAEPWTVPAAP